MEAWHKLQLVDLIKSYFQASTNHFAFPTASE